MEGKKVLLTGFGQETEKVCGMLSQYGLSSRVVLPEETGEKIGYLCGLPGFRANRKKTESGTELVPVMLFYGLEQEELDRVLKALKDSGIQTRSLKAVVTPTNQGWTLSALQAEVQQEHQVMEALIRLKQYRDQIPMPKPTEMQLIMAMMYAESLLSGTREVTLEEANAAYDQLVKAWGK